MADPLKKNVDGAYQHEADYRPLEDKVLAGFDRDVVVRAAANSLAQQFSLEVLQAIVDGGFDVFERIARTQWHVHEFTTDHYRKAFAIVQAAYAARSARVAGVSIH